MGTRRKLNWEAIRAGVGKPPPDDGKPWFVVRLFAPPEGRKVRALWSNGTTELVQLSAGVWRDTRFELRDTPVAWKPPGPFSEPTDSAWKPKPTLPDPLHFGIVVK